MELVPYIIVFGIGFASGIWVEWKYGKQGSADVAAIKAAVQSVTAQTPPAA